MAVTGRVGAVSFRILEPTESQPPSVGPQTGDSRARVSVVSINHKRLGLKNLRLHDLRHDATSTMTMAGVSQRAVMAMLGHRDLRMTVRYQHLSPEHLHD